jgi:hypothetical protein
MNATEDSDDDAPEERDDVSDWEQDDGQAPSAGETLVVDVEGFEGPLDLLLALARTQKVDLARISVLALAQQYLDFINEARRLRLEIAADYLVMAAWLAFLKSKLLLPAEQDEDGEPSGEELAQLLAFRLKRLDAMREAAAQLMTRKRLGRDVFARGMPEPLRISRMSTYQADLYDLLAERGAGGARASARHDLRLGAARSSSCRVPGRTGTAQDGIGERLHRNFGNDPRRRAGDQAGEAIRAAPRSPPRGRGRFNGLTTTKEVNE